MPSSTSRRAWHESRRTAALWAGLLAGPLVWLAALEVNYVMSYVACESSAAWMLHAVNAVSAGIVGLAGWLAWRSGPARSEEHATSPDSPATTELRARWMSAGGVATSLWFILVILAMEIPVAMLPPCAGR